MTGIELPVWMAAGSASIALLTKAVLLGKQIANGKSNNGHDGFREFDRERMNNVMQSATRDHASILVSITSLLEDTKEQTAVLREVRDNIRDVCAVIRTNIPR